MQYASRKDLAHAPIKAELEAAGFFVVDLSRVGAGCPDLAISRNGCWALVELKTPINMKTARGRRKTAANALRPSQIDFAANAKGPIITAYNSSTVVYDFNLLIKRRVGYALE